MFFFTFLKQKIVIFAKNWRFCDFTAKNILLWFPVNYYLTKNSAKKDQGGENGRECHFWLKLSHFTVVGRIAQFRSKTVKNILK